MPMNAPRPIGEQVLQPGRKRFYLVGPDFNRNPSDFKFPNRKEIRLNGNGNGRHENKIGGFYGLPNLVARPEFYVGKNKPLDFYGLSSFFVSSRAKNLLAEIDPKGFEFCEADSYDRNGSSIEPYWLTAIARCVDEFDESQSDYQLCSEVSEEYAASRTKCYINSIYDIAFSSDLDDTLAFHIPQFGYQWIFGGALVDAWRANTFTGLKFTPLQPPTKTDLKSASHFDNYLYWKERLGQ